MSPVVIALDGPSGSGKSSTARGVAAHLGLAYLDTGAMYRALTWALLRRGVDVEDADAVAAAARTVSVDAGTNPDRPTIQADGVDVAGLIREPEVTAAVSAVSAVPAVRAQLLALQRAYIAQSDGIVVEGRDIGSVVAPHAALKVFLVADQAARAQRRTAEQRGAAGPDDPELVRATAEDLERRDRIDSSRQASPLVKAEGAVVVDTTNLDLDEVVAEIVKLADQVT